MFYRVDIHSSGANRTWKNTLYYQSGENEALGAFANRGADELAERVKDWVVPAFLGVYNNYTRVDAVTVYPFDDNFHLQTFLPATVPVGLSGNYPQFGEPLPPEQGLLIKFVLAPVPVFALSDMPHSGRLFISGLTEAHFELGQLTENLGDESVPGSRRARLRHLCNRLADVLSNPIIPDFVEIGEFRPVRAKSKKILGVWKIVGYSNVISAQYGTRIAYLRSRLK